MTAETATPARPRALTRYKPYWAKRFGPAPFLPMSRAEMDALGWDECDVIVVTGDAYVDHPSFGMAVIGRVLEAQGFRVGIIAQPDWQSAEPFKALGKPRLFFGVTAGNMDSMINRYTADRKIRSDDAYTPGGEGGKRPDRSSLVYAQRCREAWSDVPIVIGGIEASLRRIAHYDYWQDKVRRSILVDSKADLLLYGNAELQVLEIASTGMALGIDPEQTYEVASFQLRAGDVLLSFTDGLTDAVNFDEQRFGKERVRGCVRSVLESEPDASAARIVDQIMWTLRSFRGLRVPNDDVTVVAVRVTG